MPGSLLRDDWQSAVEDELRKHVQGLQQPVQQAFQVVQDAPRPDPQQVLQELQAHVQHIAQPVEQAASPAIQFGQEQVAQPVQQAAQGVVQFGQQQQVQDELQNYVSQVVESGPQQQAAADYRMQVPSVARAELPAGASVPSWLQDLIQRNAPEHLKSDPEFIRTVAAGAKAESGWDPNSVQRGYELGSGAGARGLFQFDMGGMGAKYRGREQELLGESGAELQARDIVPLYARAYESAPADLTGAEKASWVAAQAERPSDYQNPQSAARRGYASAFGDIAGAVGGAVEAAGRVGQAIQEKARDISQFGDKQLTAAEANAACGPAAAVRFAQRFGRNPTLREATDLAASVGWTEGQGMAGIGSEQKLMDKMGIETKLVPGAQWDQFAAEAQTGNPVTISTSAHYFYADGYNPETGQFHVGRSGTDLRGGQEWMTRNEIEAAAQRLGGGTVQGALFANNPNAPTSTTQVAASMGAQQPLVAPELEQIDTAIDRAFQIVGDVGQTVSTAGAGGLQVIGDAAQAAGFRAPSETVQRQARGEEDVQLGPIRIPGQVAAPFGVLGELQGGPSPTYPTGGPLAGPPTGLGREMVGTEQLAREFQQQTGVSFQQFTNLANAESDAIDRGEQADFSPRVKGLEMTWNELSKGGIQTQLEAYGRAPESEQTKTELLGGAVSAVGSTALLPGGIARTPAGIARAAGALAIDPTQAPFAAAGEAIPAGVRGARALLEGTEETGGFVAPGARAAAAATPEIAAELGGTVAGGVAGNIATPEDATLEERLRNIGIGAATGLGVTAAGTRVVGRGRRGTAAAVPPEIRAGAVPVEEAPVPARAPSEPGQEAPPFAGNIRLEKYTPEAVREVIEETWRADPTRFEAARRGTIPDAEVVARAQEQVRELAEQTGVDVKRIEATWKPGDAENAETIYALRQTLADRAVAVQDAQVALREAPDSVDARVAFTRALTEHAAVQEAVSGVTGEAGRALRQFRQPVAGAEGQVPTALAVLQRIAKKNGLKPDEVADYLANAALDSPEDVARVARAMSDPTVRDKLEAVWYFLLLSSPMTHIRNTVSNGLVTATRPIEELGAAAVDLPRTAIQAGVQRARGQAVTARRERFFGEPRETLFGYAAALPESLSAAYRTLRTGFTPEQLANPEMVARAEPFRGRLADLTVNVPGRALQASDALFRNMHTRGSTYQQAYRQARQEGLKGEAFSERISQLRANPTKDMVTAAMDEGAYRVFQQKGDFVNAMGQLRENAPLLKFPLPFVQTPYNVGKYALERTPLGAISAAQAKTGGELSDRLARGAIGTATMALFYNYAAAGNLTGEAPRDPTERDAFYRQGKQPYSIKVGDTWHSYASLQPLTTLLGGVTALAEANKAGDANGVDTATAVMTGGLAMGRALLDQPWLQGTQELVDLMSGADIRDPDDVLDRASQYMQRTATSFIPSIVRNLARAQDPTIRKPERGLAGIPQAVAAQVPGLQEFAPPKLTAFGEEAQRPNEGLGMLIDPRNPSAATTDPLELELEGLQKLGYNVQPGLVNRRISVLETPVQLTEAEQAQYQRLAGSLSQELLNDIVETPEYKALPDEKKVETIEKVIEQVRGKVRDALKPGLTERVIDVRMRQARQRAG